VQGAKQESSHAAKSESVPRAQAGIDAGIAMIADTCDHGNAGPGLRGKLSAAAALNRP